MCVGTNEHSFCQCLDLFGLVLRAFVWVLRCSPVGNVAENLVTQVINTCFSVCAMRTSALLNTVVKCMYKNIQLYAG